MSKEQYTTLSENFESEIVKEKQKKKTKKYRDYLPEFFLDNIEPIDNTDIAYILE
jgi:hypothetical protein